MDIYRELIFEHYKHPHNFGHIDNPDVAIEEGNVTCGDKIIIELKINQQEKNQIIEDIRFSGSGCAISQASASMLTDKIKAMKLKDVMKLKTKDIIDMLGTVLTPSRTKCAVLCLEVAQKAVKQGLTKNVMIAK